MKCGVCGLTSALLLFSLFSHSSLLIPVNENRETSKQHHGAFKDLIQPYVAFLDDVYLYLSGSNAKVNVSAKCQTETKAILQLAEAGDPAALRFFDATGKPSAGVLEGGVSFPGFYSECLKSEIKLSDASEYSFSGKYCLVTINATNADNGTAVLPQASWAILAKLPPSVGLCVASSCQPVDVQNAVTAGATTSFPGTAVTSPSCSEKLAFSQDVAAICILVLIIIFIALAVSSTCFDLLQSNTSKNLTMSTEVLCEVQRKNSSRSLLSKCFLSFSLTRNASKILTVRASSGESIGALHGLRFLSMVLIIFGHTYSFAHQDLFFRNPGTMLDAPKQFVSQIFANGTLAVDTFYFISGLLVTYVVLKGMMKREGKFPYLYFYLHRYIRLTPLLLMVIAFCATLLRYAGSGPKYHFSIQMYDDWCKKNWWLNALYLQNFINTEHMCLSHSWYLATDMQFYIITPLILVALYKKLWYGLIVMMLFFTASVATTAVLTVLRHFPAIPYTNNEMPLDLVNEYYREVYIKPYCRIGPYLIGIIAGYTLVKKKELHLTKFQSAAAWLISTFSMLFVIFIMSAANAGRLPPVGGAAAYSALARSVWAVGIAWITLACFYGYGGFVNTLLSWNPIVSLSRLTYCAYLIHPVIMAMYYGSTETTVDFSYSFMIYLFLGNVMSTYVVSFFGTLLFESPLIELEKSVTSG